MHEDRWNELDAQMRDSFYEAVNIAMSNRITEQLKAQREEIKAWAEGKVTIHQELIDMHTVAPFEYHRGNINSLEEIINYIDELKD